MKKLLFLSFLLIAGAVAATFTGTQIKTSQMGQDYTIGNPANAAGAVVLPNVYAANDVVSIAVYAVLEIEGNRVFSAVPSTTSDVTSNDVFGVNWTWDAVAGATFYRLIRTQDTGSGPVSAGTQDTTDAFFLDDGSNPAAWGLTDSVTPASPAFFGANFANNILSVDGRLTAGLADMAELQFRGNQITASGAVLLKQGGNSANTLALFADTNIFGFLSCFDVATNPVAAINGDGFVGNGQNLTNLQGANVVGSVPQALQARNLYDDGGSILNPASNNNSVDGGLRELFGVPTETALNWSEGVIAFSMPSAYKLYVTGAGATATNGFYNWISDNWFLNGDEASASIVQDVSGLFCHLIADDTVTSLYTNDASLPWNGTWSVDLGAGPAPTVTRSNMPGLVAKSDAGDSVNIQEWRRGSDGAAVTTLSSQGVFHNRDTNGSTFTDFYTDGGVLYSQASPRNRSISEDEWALLSGKVVTNAIDGTSSGQTVIYTVPAGRTALIQRILIQPTTVTGLVILPTVSVGKTGAGYVDVVAGGVLAGVTAVNTAQILAPINGMSVLQAGDQLKINVTAGTATAYTFSVTTIGLLQ